VESAIQWNINDSLTWNTNFTYLDARLTQDLATSSGTIADGTAMPGASHWTVNNSLTWYMNLPWSPRLILTHQYLSKAPVTWNSEVQRGDYNLYNLKASVVKGPYEVNFYINNLFDQYGIVNAPYATPSSMLVTVVRPRTIGLTFSWKYY